MPLVINYKANVDESEYVYGCLVERHEEDSSQEIIYFSPAKEKEMIEYIAKATGEITVVDVENGFEGYNDVVNYGTNPSYLFNNEETETRIQSLVVAETKHLEELKLEEKEKEKARAKEAAELKKLEHELKQKIKELKLLEDLKAKYESKA